MPGLRFGAGWGGGGRVAPGGEFGQSLQPLGLPAHPEWQRLPPHHPNPLPGIDLAVMVVMGSVAGGPRVSRGTIPIELALVVIQP